MSVNAVDVTDRTGQEVAAVSDCLARLDKVNNKIRSMCAAVLHMQTTDRVVEL